MRLSIFFIFLIFLAILWSFFIKPYKIELRPLKNLPETIFYDFTTYEIDKNGLKTKLIGRLGKKFRDRLEIDDFYFFKLQEELKAKKVIYKQDILYLNGDIFYKYKDIKFFSNSAIYDTKKDIVKCNDEFVLLTKKSKILGDSLIYYKNKGKIFAKNIDAKIFEENSR